MSLLSEVISILSDEAEGLGFELFAETVYGSDQWKAEHYPVLAVEHSDGGMRLCKQLGALETAGSNHKSTDINESVDIYLFFACGRDDVWQTVRGMVMTATQSILDLLGRSLDFHDRDARVDPVPFLGEVD